MLRMVDALNQEYIGKMGRTAPVRVECVTCHHQLSIPKTMNALLAETIDKKDVQAAIVVYRDLRKNDLGSGKYDFGETSLNILTESLLKQDKTKEAVAIMELNVEVNTPPSGWAYSLLAMSHVANKEVDKAKADFQRILELNPQLLKLLFSPLVLEADSFEFRTRSLPAHWHPSTSSLFTNASELRKHVQFVPSTWD